MFQLLLKACVVVSPCVVSPALVLPVCAVALPVCVKAQPVKKNAAPPLPLDTAVHTGKLPNGFTYYIRHNEQPKNRVTMYLVNKAGSILERDDQQGLAHFMEHMSFNGTRHFPKNELIDYLQKSGVRFGADLNAYTSFDETVYQLPLPTDKPEILKNGMQIMRDWAQDATLDPAEIDKERGVVLEEKRSHKGAEERMRFQYWPLITNGSHYSERLPIGTDTVLNNFKPEVIRRFYQDWYRPDLQALIIVGDVDIAQTEAAVRELFADLKNPKREQVRTVYNVPLTGKNQFMAVTDPEMTATVAEVMIKHTAPKLITEADYRNSIVDQLFNMLLGQRYAGLSRQTDPPFIQVQAGIQEFLGGLDNYTASVVIKPGQFEKGLKALWRETERVRRFGFTATELARAKATYLGLVGSSEKEKNKTLSESYVREYVQYFLKGAASPGIEAEYKLVQQFMPGIGLNDLQDVAKEYITSINRDILILAPEKEKSRLPDETAVVGWLKAVETGTLEPYQDQVSTLPLLQKEPVAGKIIARQRDTALNLTTLTLGNGTKVLLKPTDFKNNEILFTAFAPGGTSLYTDADYQSAAYAAGLIGSFGVGNYKAPQLDKYLSDKQLAVRPAIADRFQIMNGGCVNKDLGTTLQLIYAYFTEPRTDSGLFNNYISRSKAGLANRGNDPGSIFQDTMSAILGNYNVRRTGPSAEKLDQVDLQRSYRIYRERFADASNFTFIFTGSFDTAVIIPLIEKYIGSLPVTNSHEVAKDLNIHTPEGKITKTVYKGSEPRATVRLVFSGTFGYTAVNKANLDALKEVLEIRLLQRLREEESGVYTPGVMEFNSKYPQSRYTFIVQFGCSPDNVEKLISSTLDEIGKLRSDGPSPVNVEKYKAEDARAMETARKTNSWWLDYLNAQLQNGDDLHEYRNDENIRNKVTVESLKDAAEKYLGGKNYIRLVLLPQSTAKSD